MTTQVKEMKDGSFTIMDTATNSYMEIDDMGSGLVTVKFTENEVDAKRWKTAEAAEQYLATDKREKDIYRKEHHKHLGWAFRRINAVKKLFNKDNNNE